MHIRVFCEFFFGITTIGAHHVVASVTKAIYILCSLQLITMCKWFGAWGEYTKRLSVICQTDTELLSLYSSDLAIKHCVIFANYNAYF